MLNGLALKTRRLNTTTLIGSGSVDFPGGAFALSGHGARAGDLLVGWVHGTGSTLSLNSAAVTPLTGGQGRFFVKGLTEAEISAGGGMSTGGWWLILRGPQLGSVRTTATVAGTGPTTPGFTKAGACAALIYGGAASGASAAPTISQPGWTYVGDQSSGSSNANFVSVGHNLNPATYTDGASIPTGGSSNGSTSATILELTY